MTASIKTRFSVWYDSTIMKGAQHTRDLSIDGTWHSLFKIHTQKASWIPTPGGWVGATQHVLVTIGVIVVMIVLLTVVVVHAVAWNEDRTGLKWSSPACVVIAHAAARKDEAYVAMSILSGVM